MGRASAQTSPDWREGWGATAVLGEGGDRGQAKAHRQQGQYSGRVVCV